MTIQATRATYTYTRTFSHDMVNWLKKGLVRDGFMPEDLSVASGSEVLRQTWLNVHRRSVNDVQHEVRVMWYQAVEMEEGISTAEATERVDTWIANLESGVWVDVANEVTIADELEKVDLTATPTLNQAEATAARKIHKMANSNPVSKQVLFYMLQGYPTHSVNFCKTAGIHTATMKATVHNLTKAANCPKDENLVKYLKQILMISQRSQGGLTK